MDELLKKYDIPNPICGASAPTSWLPILESLIQDLIAMGWNKDLHQVKTKFGDLRFYIGEGTEEMRNRIYQAEDECHRTEKAW